MKLMKNKIAPEFEHKLCKNSRFFVKFGAKTNKLNNCTAPFGAVFLYQKSERKNYNGT